MDLCGGDVIASILRRWCSACNTDLSQMRARLGARACTESSAESAEDHRADEGPRNENRDDHLAALVEEVQTRGAWAAFGMLAAKAQQQCLRTSNIEFSSYLCFEKAQDHQGYPSTQTAMAFESMADEDKLHWLPTNLEEAQVEAGTVCWDSLAIPACIRRKDSCSERGRARNCTAFWQPRKPSRLIEHAH